MVSPIGLDAPTLILAKSIAKSIVFLHARVFGAESTVKFEVRTKFSAGCKVSVKIRSGK